MRSCHLQDDMNEQIFCVYFINFVHLATLYNQSRTLYYFQSTFLRCVVDCINIEIQALLVLNIVFPIEDESKIMVLYLSEGNSFFFFNHLTHVLWFLLRVFILSVKPWSPTD